MKTIFRCSNLFKINSSNRLCGRYLTGVNLWNEELTSDVKHKIEKHWSSKLTVNNYNENDSNNKYYVLSMFPYPSGNLHMGHVRVYTISDSVARFQRLNKKNVIHPIGWDSFGLPAENAAIERKVAPEEWTRTNIAQMKLQLQRLGCSFEWERELATCDPTYYKWTQELFLKLFDAGLAYQKRAMVNWDPIDKTVLADEQVDENNCSWRSGAKVERKLLKQWFIKTTKFAKSLLDGLNDPLLEDWRDITKIQQHWIGNCNGVSLDFELSDGSDFLSLWTAYPEYVEHAKFIAISSKHSLSHFLKENTLLNLQAKNPLNNAFLPIFITDEIEFLESTDSHIGIPGIVEEDSNFCHKYNIKFSPVEPLDPHELIIKQKAVCNLAKKLKAGGHWTSAKLRDWLISRQRYWGTPIPIIYCSNCGTLPVPRTELPVILPKGVSSLSEATNWINTVCPKCKGTATRETDTMDTFVDSSWYYLRYLNPNNSHEMFDVKQANSMTPVDLYIGGKEHATLHLYYARFVNHFLHSLGLLPEKEPFKRLLVQGMVMGRSFRIKGTGQYVTKDEINVIDAKRNKAIHKETQQPVVMSWEKMSKSKHNGVDPTEMFDEYGVDTTRLLILADVAPTSHRNWNSNTFPGILNWQKRLWMTIQQFIERRENLPQELQEKEFSQNEDYLFDSRNFYIKGTIFNYCISQQLSVAISKMQGLTNSLRRVPPAMFAHSLQFERCLASLIILLAPMAPHFASELWSGFLLAPNRLNKSSEIQWDKTVFAQTLPDVDWNYNLDLVCQVNGTEHAIVKIVRCELEKLESNKAIDIALQQSKIQNVLSSRSIKDCQFTLFKGYEGIVNIETKSKTRHQVVEN